MTAILLISRGFIGLHLWAFPLHSCYDEAAKVKRRLRLSADE